MTGKSRVVCDYDIVAEIAVMRNMHIPHHKIIIADSGCRAFFGSYMDGYKFPEGVAISDFKKSIFTPDIDFCNQVAKEHRAIFAALKDRQGDVAEARMLAHLRYLENYQMDEQP